ncbi:MAG: hypothetical protein ACE5L6_05130 [Candidatus Bathyarchaeia archaeon]
MIKKWLQSRKVKAESEYDQAKREFEVAMGKPFITIKVEVPTGFEDLHRQFLSLEKDEQFHEEVKDLVKKRLILERRYRKRKRQL